MSFDLRKIAELAKLELSEKEKESLGQQLNDIVSWVKALEELPFSGESLPFEFNPKKPSMARADEKKDKSVENGLSKNAPALEAGLLLVPSILKEGKK